MSTALYVLGKNATTPLLIQGSLKSNGLSGGEGWKPEHDMHDVYRTRTLHGERNALHPIPCKSLPQPLAYAPVKFDTFRPAPSLNRSSATGTEPTD